MGSFKTITDSDISQTTSVLNQLVDVIQNDVSESATRKKYQVFVTGGIGPGVTSSLFQTVYDQDFSLQTANAVLDLTVGLYSGSSVVQDSVTGEDTQGKLLFPSSSMMMREKIDLYRQYAQLLLGNSTGSFFAPGINQYDVVTSNGHGTAMTGPSGSMIENALFINYKRLFARDEIKRETFAMRIFSTGVFDGSPADDGHLLPLLNGYTGSNTDVTSPSGSMILADVGSSNNQLRGVGGDVGYIKNTAATDQYMGLIWYDHGIVILDISKCFFGQQHISGTIGAMSNGTYRTAVAGQAIIGSDSGCDNPNARLVPDLLVSASIDDIVDYFATCRIGSGSQTMSTFQNVTNINSTLYFCRATADEMNYSSNPTFRDTSGNIVVVDSSDTNARTFSFVTTVGLYNENNQLLAVAKLSRPIEKNDERDLSIRVRLDF
jgi:hypothetical protein|tara:strand:+ start:14647 stop:15948 length:1302 start_codon:yes stop_codon:yes gene_type:complete